MWHSFGHSLNCDNEFDEMSDFTVNTTDIKCRVYVAKFLCVHCLCLHGKLLFLCVSGTNISSWIGEVLFMCWQCLTECRLRISFSATNHARAQVGAFFSLQIFMNADVHIYLYILYHYAEFQLSWHCRSSVRFTRSKAPLTFSFHSFTFISLCIHTFLLTFYISKTTRIAFINYLGIEPISFLLLAPCSTAWATRMFLEWIYLSFPRGSFISLALAWC